MLDMKRKKKKQKNTQPTATYSKLMRGDAYLQEGTCHQGTKCSKVTFLDNGKVLTTGFSRYSDRQYSIWDQHDLKNPLHQEVMDSSSGVVTPYFDYDTRMVRSLALDLGSSKPNPI